MKTKAWIIDTANSNTHKATKIVKGTKAITAIHNSLLKNLNKNVLSIFNNACPATRATNFILAPMK